MTRARRRSSWILVATLAATLPAVAQEPPPSKEGLADAYPARKNYSPYVGRDFPSRVYWGDTHLHTALSFDAGAFGARLLPADAYRFARGEEVVSSTGQPVRLSRPLDFLVVADHSDNMGLFERLFNGDPEILADPDGRRIYDNVKAGGEKGVEAALELIDRFSKNTLPKAMLSLPGDKAYRKTWDSMIRAAEAANEPGRFTAFIGWEWTSNTNGNNLHRVVVYRDGKDRASQLEPYTTVPPLGSDNPRDLWKWLAGYEQKTGGSVLAIAHNGNLSNGIMFPFIESFGGKPIDRAYAETRRRWEPIYEVTQIKGDGETHKFLSPNDEFAGYEIWDKANLNMSAPKTNAMLQFEYARSALKNGLKLEAELGVNPYKFGMIGSTDAHTALPAVEENNFFGKHSGVEPSPTRAEHPVGCFGKVCVMGWEQAASGYAAVWARDNSRESLFDAMQRREVYATTGPRMLVRFFGGWNFGPADATTREPAVPGYGKGVPMGADLPAAPAGKTPTFLVAALKDPIGANLDRVQIVKGWVDAKGDVQEKVYDVAWSGARKAGADGKVPAVGSTVDVATATWTNTIGSSELITTWTDPSFDPKLRAFYYARVIEIPTPRWTAYDAMRYGVKMKPEVPMTTQERAYTSPIWYTPGK